MQEYNLKIPENDSRALALLDYLKTLDFIQLSKITDWYEELTNENKHSVQRGLNDLENGNNFSNEDISKSIRQRIQAAKR